MVPLFCCDFFWCENEKNTVCRRESFNDVWLFVEIDSPHFQSEILAIEKTKLTFLKVVIDGLNFHVGLGIENNDLMHTVIYSINKDSKGSFGPESNDN